MLRYGLEDGDELVVRYNFAVAMPHRDLISMSTFHGDNVIALWVSVVAVAARGRGTIRAE